MARRLPQKPRTRKSAEALVKDRLGWLLTLFCDGSGAMDPPPQYARYYRKTVAQWADDLMAAEHCARCHSSEEA